MIVVRYVTLAALVLWLGAMLGARFGDLQRQMPLLPLACGAATFAGLFATKFMGPPPAGFIPRVAIAFLMLMVAVPVAWLVPADAAPLLLTVNIVLGFALLYWYARE
jgi:hypothetical protein